MLAFRRDGTGLVGGGYFQAHKVEQTRRMQHEPCGLRFGVPFERNFHLGVLEQVFSPAGFCFWAS